MSGADAAEQCLRDGDPAGALALLQEQVRSQPGDARLRVFLFQLLCVLGQWSRALAQLKVAADLDPAALPMAQMYGEAIRCEALRRDVFEGRRSPLILGEPEGWLALLIESLLTAGQGRMEHAEELRQRAFDEAEPSAGALNGRPFEWIADADSRLGPVLEAVINGRYYWLPFTRLRSVAIEAPTDLRDTVWAPAHLQFDNGGEAVALVPVRYPFSDTSDDAGILMARKTLWEPVGQDRHHGLGQRVLSTDTDEVPVLDVRSVTLGAGAGQAPA